MKRIKRIRLLFFIIFTSSIFLIPSCSAFSFSDDNGGASVVLESDTDRNTVTATGSVTPQKQALLSFKLDAFDIRILVDPGSRVQAGEILVTSDTYHQTLALEDAKAQLARAEAVYDGLLREDFREVRQAEKDAAFENIEAAQALVDLAEDNLDAAAIKAPFSGTVIEFYPNSYENVSAAKPVALIADLDTLRIETEDLDEKDAGRLALGDSVEIYFDALPDVILNGRVVEVSQKVEAGSGNDFNVVISPQELPDGLRWGMSAYVVITPRTSAGLAGEAGNTDEMATDDGKNSESETNSGDTRVCDNADFANETIPDGTGFAAGVRFTKIWTLRNAGTCTWQPDYKLVFLGGDRMKGPDKFALGKYVAPGDLLTLEIDLETPDDPGAYFGSWQLQNELNQKVFDLWVDIQVVQNQ